jgi:hypothetical protein
VVPLTAVTVPRNREAVCAPANSAAVIRAAIRIVKATTRIFILLFINQFSTI